MTSTAPNRAILLLALLTGPASEAFAEPCASDDTTLCLQSDRFRIRTDWRNPFGPGAGAGTAVGLTSDTGFFWFFSPENLEVTLKVIDGRGYNDAFWVFYGSLSNVEFEIEVTDLATGWQRSYLNPPFEQTAGASITAFVEDPLPGDLLFVGAHPDDETLVAPVLGELCRERGRRCSFLVLTRGESGSCALPGGCLPDLGTVRAQEMANAAAIFGAELDLWTLPDVSGPTPAAVRAEWARQSGGDAALIERIRAAIAASGAETVVTLDARHGSTCHPAHRALGGLVRDALGAVAAPPILFEVQTRFAPLPALEWGPALTGDAGSLGLDGARAAPLLGGTDWDYLLADAAVHTSQVPASLLQALRELPVRDRRVFLRRSDAPDDPRLAAICGD